MRTRQSAEEYLEGRDRRRMKVEHRHLTKLEEQEKASEKMIGELTRNGRTVYYVYPVGGRYKESNSFFDLMFYLIRNKYI